MYSSIAEGVFAEKEIREGWKLRGNAGDWERYFIDYNYQCRVLGNLETARQTCDLWAQAYPRDTLPHSFLAGQLLQSAGKFERSEEEGKKPSNSIRTTLTATTTSPTVLFCAIFRPKRKLFWHAPLPASWTSMNSPA